MGYLWYVLESYMMSLCPMVASLMALLRRSVRYFGNSTAKFTGFIL